MSFQFYRSRAKNSENGFVRLTFLRDIAHQSVPRFMDNFIYPSINFRPHIIILLTLLKPRHLRLPTSSTYWWRKNRISCPPAEKLGCDKTLASKKNLGNHISMVHNEVRLLRLYQEARALDLVLTRICWWYLRRLPKRPLKRQNMSCERQTRYHILISSQVCSYLQVSSLLSLSCLSLVSLLSLSCLSLVSLLWR